MKKGIKIAIALFVSLFILTIFLKKQLYSATKNNSLSLHIENLKSGDIILRRESNQISDIFAKINSSEYSHIGVILLQKGHIKVIHIEAGDGCKDYRVVDAKEFLNFAFSYAIYRPKKKVNIQNLQKKVAQLKLKNIEFDSEFTGKKDDNKIYCTELALELYNFETQDSYRPKMSSYMGKKFISIKAFLNPKHFTLISKESL